MQVVILAGGLATRLENITKNQPKSMIKVLNKPFLEYQIEWLKNEGINDIVLCIGHMGEQIKNYFGNGEMHNVRIRYSREDELLGTAGALKNAQGLLGDIFFTLYGDSYLFLNFNTIIRYFESNNKLALMTVYKNFDNFDNSNTAIDGDLIKKYSKKEKTEDMVYIDYGANIFRKEVLDLIPGDRFYSLEDLFIDLIEKEQFLAFEVKERFYEIGSIQGLNEFEGYIGSRLN